MFDISKINCPKVAVDAVIQTEENNDLILIERKFSPHGIALVGGFVDYGESLEDAIIREVKEEIGLDFDIMMQLPARSNPDRDPRGHIITIPFWGIVWGTPKAKDDAKSIFVLPAYQVDEDIFGRLNFAFKDHIDILIDYLELA